MAHFWGKIQGSSHGSASRVGSKISGIHSLAQGHSFGVRVSISHKDGVDVARIFLTPGEARDMPERLLGEFTRQDLELFIKHGNTPYTDQFSH